jgi:hypothetical protein
MNKVFGKIRQTMIKENRASKYMLYAIGEIVLVVIGILIALQINNWNENRKAEIKQHHLFNNLKIDFDSRLKELNEMNTARKEGIRTVIEINSIIANPNNRPNDSILDSLFSKMINGYKFNEEFKMLDVLFSTGLINDIKNEELKRKLIEWPQQVEEMLEEQRMHNRLMDNEFKQLLAKYVALRAIYEKFNFRQYNIPKGEPVTLIKNYDGLLSDPLLENYLAEEEILLRVNSIDTDILIASAQDIINLLNDEKQ